MNALKPIAEGLWSNNAQQRLIGARRKSDGEIIFPMPSGDAADDYDAVELSPTGALWSWTIQSFRPKTPPYIGPEEFTPFAIGYVELPDQVIVETRLTQTHGLKIGMAMELVIQPFDGSVLTYAFRPVEAA
jgi:uncharacterized OB-fold protein